MKITIEIKASDNSIGKIEKKDMMERVLERVKETLVMFGDAEVKVKEDKK